MTLTNLDPLLRTFTDVLLPESAVTVRRRQGVVDAVNVSPPTIDVTLGGLLIPGLSYLGSYAPVIGDVVVVDLNGSDPLVIGNVTGTGTGSVSTSPVGSLLFFAKGISAESGYLPCNGGSFDAGDHPALAAYLGGTTLPDYRGCVLVMQDAAQTEFDTLGEMGGSKTSTASHWHGLEAHDHSADHNHDANIGNLNWTSNTVHNHMGHPGYVTEGAEPNNGIPVAVPVNVDTRFLQTSGWENPGGAGESSEAVPSGNLQPYKVANIGIKT